MSILWKKSPNVKVGNVFLIKNHHFPQKRHLVILQFSLYKSVYEYGMYMYVCIVKYRKNL
jgi:hypothetical protein